MTIQADPQDHGLRYIPYREYTREDVDTLTGIARQYAEDVITISDVARAHIRLRELDQIESRNSIIEKNDEIIHLSKKLIDRNYANAYWKFGCIVAVILVSICMFFMIAHDAKWFRVFKSW